MNNEIKGGDISQLLRAFEFVAGACSSDKWANEIFKCVRIEIFNDEQMAFVATDKFRMHWAGVGISEAELISGISQHSALVNKKEFGALLKGKAGAFSLKVDEDTYTLSASNSSTVGQVVKGDYPNWRALVPTLGAGDILTGSMLFNPVLLGATLSTAGKVFKTERPTKFSWTGNESHKPVRLSQLNDDDSAGALVMPCRGVK